MLQVYAVYTHKNYSDVYLLLVDFDEQEIKFLAFNKVTLEMECLYVFSRWAEEYLDRVGYTYLPDRNPTIKMKWQ